MPAQNIRGIEDPLFPTRTRERDVRPMGRRIHDALHGVGTLSTLIFSLAAGAVMFSGEGAWLLLIAALFTRWGLKRPERAPLKLPIQIGGQGVLDQNEVHPKTKNPMKAEGIFYIGNEIRSRKEVWLTNSDCRQHFMVLGTTGAGKALPDDALVHTPSGWKPMGGLRVGDVVSTPDGGSAAIDGVFPQGELDIWRITFADGRTVECCAEHLWPVIGADGCRRTLQTTDIAEALATGEALMVPLPEPVEQEERAPADERLDLEAMLAAAGDPIPAALLEGSVAQRRVVLSHLLGLPLGELPDTNNPASVTSFVASRDRAFDIQTLAWSLGLFATAHSGPDFHVVVVRFGMRGLGIARVDAAVRRARATCIHVDHPDHLFIAENYVVTHNTELLLGFAANAMSWGSGLIYVDGKGDVSLFAKVFAMARRWGREDDLLVLNFMNGGKSDTSPNGSPRTNTMNPFANNSADALVQMVVSLMPGGGGGSNDMWKGRATAMFTGVMYALVWLRDHGFIDLGVQEIREHLTLKKIMSLADRGVWPDMPESIVKSVRAYLSSLAGFQEEKGENQSPQTREQHGYLEMQFTQIFGSLTDVYANVFKTQYGEIDMFDVVLNRRILICMLPALEKEDGELANLGKIVTAALKGMMGGTLGNTIDGTWATVVDNRVTNAPSPFFAIFDEVGYYMVNGMAVMAAQARSLGFGLVFASQDLPALKRNAEKEADSVIANTATKILMRTEDFATGKLATDSGGKGIKIQASGFERESGEFGSRYIENDGVSYQESDRVEWLDLKGQNPGELTVLWKNKNVRVNSFYANPSDTLNKRNLRLRPNHFIHVLKPTLGELDQARRAPLVLSSLLDEQTPAMMRREADALLNAGPGTPEGSTEIAAIARVLQQCRTMNRPPVNGGCIAVASLARAQAEAAQTFSRDIRTARASSRGGLPSAAAAMPEEFDFVDNDAPTMPGSLDLMADLPFDVPPAAATAPPSRPPRDARMREVTHGAAVDNNPLIAMERDIAGDADMNAAFAALNFDGDDVTESPATVNQRLDAALNPPTGAQPVRKEQVEPLATADTMFERLRDAAKEPEDEESGGSDKNVLDFLDFLTAGGEEEAE